MRAVRHGAARDGLVKALDKEQRRQEAGKQPGLDTCHFVPVVVHAYDAAFLSQCANIPLRQASDKGRSKKQHATNVDSWIVFMRHIPIMPVCAHSVSHLTHYNSQRHAIMCQDRVVLKAVAVRVDRPTLIE